MQHIRSREKRVSSSFGDCEKDISEFEGNPADSDPGYEVKHRKQKHCPKCLLGDINHLLFSQSPVCDII